MLRPKLTIPPAALALPISAWPPPLYDVRHGVAAPLGAVKLSRAGKSQVREIKVRLDGVPSYRWVRLARYWWERHKGPVPAGHRVIHFDGDCLNDDPHNYALATAGDVISAWHLDNPKASAAQHRRAARGCARHNRQRAAVDRRRRPMMSMWYGVAIGTDRVTTGPHDSRALTYRAAGFNVTGGRNGREGYGVLLGWPGLPAAQALLLHAIQALADEAGGVSTPAAVSAAAIAASARDLTWPSTSNAVSQLLYSLRRRGFITSRRGGRRASLHFVSSSCPPQGPVCSIVAMRGDQLPTRKVA